MFSALDRKQGDKVFLLFAPGRQRKVAVRAQVQGIVVHIRHRFETASGEHGVDGVSKQVEADEPKLVRGVGVRAGLHRQGRVGLVFSENVDARVHGNLNGLIPPLSAEQHDVVVAAHKLGHSLEVVGVVDGKHLDFRHVPVFFLHFVLGGLQLVGQLVHEGHGANAGGAGRGMEHHDSISGNGLL